MNRTFGLFQMNFFGSNRTLGNAFQFSELKVPKRKFIFNFSKFTFDTSFNLLQPFFSKWD